jgi:very-short-patch-repair endonuclease
MAPPPSPREAAGRGRGWGADVATERKPREPDTRVPRARRLRRDMTIAEQKLWWHLRRVAPARSHFRRQATIGPYYLDFACHDLRLIIEIDGGQHGYNDQMIADTARTEFLNSRGYRVLRFWNNEVPGNIDGVLTAIQAALDEALARSPPPPTPPRHATRGGRGQPAARLRVITKSKRAAPPAVRAKEPR